MPALTAAAPSVAAVTPSSCGLEPGSCRTEEELTKSAELLNKQMFPTRGADELMENSLDHAAMPEMDSALMN